MRRSSSAGQLRLAGAGIRCGVRQAGRLVLSGVGEAEVHRVKTMPGPLVQGGGRDVCMYSVE